MRDIHALYLSTIKIEVQEDGLDMTIKVFEDDLRDALRAYHGHVVDTSSTSFQVEVESYFTAHISIAEELEIAVSSVELVGDSYVISASGTSMLDSSFDIEANYFMELFPTQQNVLHFVNGDQTKYHIFKKGKGSFEITL